MISRNGMANLLNTYTLDSLPNVAQEGSSAFIANGRKPGERYGQGTGVPVFFSRGKWCRIYDCLDVAEPSLCQPRQGDRLMPGEGLGVGQSIQDSGGQYTLVVQQDGNLCLYGGGNAVWNAGTYNHTEVYALLMRADGRLLLITGFGDTLWSAPADPAKAVPGSWLVAQEDSNVVLYDPDSHPIWSWMTGDI